MDQRMDVIKKIYHQNPLSLSVSSMVVNLILLSTEIGTYIESIPIPSLRPSIGIIPLG